MPGGLIQLAAYGSENIYLMGNPQITFFKIVYKQHTNFSVESIELPFDNHPKISEMSDKSTIFKVKIPRFADLLSKMFLKVELPDIISSKYKKFKWVKNLGEVIVKNANIFIGGQKIETITSEWLHIYHSLNLSDEKKKMYNVLIGNTPDLNCPELSDANFTHLMKRVLLLSEYEYTNTDKSFIDKLVTIIAKVESLTDGETVAENIKKTNKEMPLIIKKFLNLLQGFTDINNSNIPYYDPINIINNKSEKLKPSIKGRMLYIPLPFFFNKNIGLSLPLIALQYQEVEIQIEFAPLNHLFTILTEKNENSRPLRTRPNSLKENERLNYFIYQDPGVHFNLENNVNNDDIDNLNNDINDNINDNIKDLDEESDDDISSSNNIHLVREYSTKIQDFYNDNNFNFNISLETFFIYLDNDERKLFANKSHEYLITQTSYKNKNGFHGNNSQIEMNLYNPVKEIIWTLKRSDLSEHNIWFNYTNKIGEDKHFSNDLFTNNNDIFINDYNNLYNDNNILINAKLLFNGIDRFDLKDNIFLSYLQPFLYHQNNNDGIYVFSFSLEPEKFQPSGAVNMSMINSVVLDFKTKKPPIDPDIKKILESDNIDTINNKIKNSIGVGYKGTGNNEYLKYITDGNVYQYTYNLEVFIVNYNILKIMGGMGGLSFNN